MLKSSRITARRSQARRSRARRVAASPVVDDVGVTDQPTGSAEPVTEASTAGEAEAPAPRRRLRLLLAVAAVVLVLDIVTKVLAVKLLTPGQPVPIIGDTVTWTLVRNSGAAFSMATGYTWMLTLIATGVVVGIFWMGRRLVSPWWAIGLGMILGGAMGNLVDRFFRSPGPAARTCRGLLVDRLVAGVQRRRPVGGRRGNPAGHAVGAGLRLRHRRPSPRRRRCRAKRCGGAAPCEGGRRLAVADARRTPNSGRACRSCPRRRATGRRRRLQGRPTLI